jgi:L-asparaginase
MIDTAKAIVKAKPQKTVVLTGAMQPLAFRETDATYNLGCAIGVLKSKPRGVFIVMGSQVFGRKDFSKMVKNREKNMFEITTK